MVSDTRHHVARAGTQRTASTAKPRAPSVLPLGAARLSSLDAFRGLTLAAMILVNNPGSWHVYAPLQHADWNGCTATDLIFPFFLFIVGVAITFSFEQRRGRGHTRNRLLLQIARRTAIIFALGMALNGFPHFEWELWRIPGVLQRIALCYCAAALIVLTTSTRRQVIITGALLFGYWALLKLVPVPGHGAGGLGPASNLGAYIDDWLLSGHLLHHRWDPEGILSTLPAIATTMTGVLAGHWLRARRTPWERIARLFIAGNVGIVCALILDAWFPINKNLWSSSFVLLTSGIAVCVLALCYWLIDIKGYWRWAIPFAVFGTNPILAYVLSSLMGKVTLLWRVTGPDGTRVVLRKYLMETLFLPWLSPLNASLLYAVAYVLLWLGVTAVLYRKRIFIKI